MPTLWRFELRNMLIVNERRGRLDEAQTVRVLRLLKGLPVTIDAAVEEDVLLQLARRHKLKVYDAAYLELAVRKGAPIGDPRHRFGARRAGGERIVDRQ